MSVHNVCRPATAGLGIKPLLVAMVAAGLFASQSAIGAEIPVAALTEISFRDAVTAANGHVDPENTITFPGLSGTITLTAGQVTVSKRLTIRGPNAGDANAITISGNNNSRIFDVADGLEGADPSNFGLTLENVHITAGNGKELSTDPVAGNGGCIRSDSGVVLNNSIVSNCTAADFGGGIFVSDQAQNAPKYGLILNQSTVTGNTASCLNLTEDESSKYACAGGGAFSSNGVIAKYSTISNNAVVTGRSNFEDDLFQSGGGLFGNFTGLIATTVSGNTLSGNADVTGSALRFGAGMASQASIR